MVEIKLKCETLEEARIYLNAQSYLGLIQDLRANLRDARKHGTDTDVLRVVDNFMSDLTQACDHADGAY